MNHSIFSIALIASINIKLSCLVLWVGRFYICKKLINVSINIKYTNFVKYKTFSFFSYLLIIQKNILFSEKGIVVYTVKMLWAKSLCIKSISNLWKNISEIKNILIYIFFISMWDSSTKKNKYFILLCIRILSVKLSYGIQNKKYENRVLETVNIYIFYKCIGVLISLCIKYIPRHVM